MRIETNTEFDNIKNLDNNPILRALLKAYCLMQYEENAITDEEHLMMEYNFLKENNKLDELFECEMLNNYFKSEFAITRLS